MMSTTQPLWSCSWIRYCRASRAVVGKRRNNRRTPASAQRLQPPLRRIHLWWSVGWEGKPWGKNIHSPRLSRQRGSSKQCRWCGQQWLPQAYQGPPWGIPRQRGKAPSSQTPNSHGMPCHRGWRQRVAESNDPQILLTWLVLRCRYYFMRQCPLIYDSRDSYFYAWHVTEPVGVACTASAHSWISPCLYMPALFRLSWLIWKLFCPRNAKPMKPWARAKQRCYLCRRKAPLKRRPHCCANMKFSPLGCLLWRLPQHGKKRNYANRFVIIWPVSQGWEPVRER